MALKVDLASTLETMVASLKVQEGSEHNGSMIDITKISGLNIALRRAWRKISYLYIICESVWNKVLNILEYKS